MTIEDRRRRDRAAQRRLITSTARALAEDEGWDAVTTRRLSTEIEYSQPVIYKHFASLDVLTEAVAVEGFEELARDLEQARARAASGAEVAAVAEAYRSYAAANPALYDVMFTRATRIHFDAEDTPEPLTRAYATIRAAVAVGAGERDVDTLTEVLWAGLHGLVTLGRTGRLRPTHGDARLAMLVAQVR